jgi:predicted NACHT family NTPase
MIGEGWAVRLLNGLVRRPLPARLPGLLLGYRIGCNGQPIVLPEARRCEHMMILGKTGVGKTHFLESIALQILPLPEALILHEYHGDATGHLLALATYFP